MKKINQTKWMKKAVIIGLCLMGILWMDQKTSFVSNAQTTGKVTTTSAKVRSEASTSSDVLGSVKSGDSVTILEEVTGNDGNVWYQIAIEGDKKGFVRSDLVTKSADAGATAQVTATDKKSGTVLKDSVRVRKDASTSSDIVATVGRGVVLTVEGEANGNDGKKWYSVSFNYNNKTVTGFIRSDFITFDALPEEEPEVTEITGNMGEEPETEAETETVVEEVPAEEETAEEAEPVEEETSNNSGSYQLLNVEEVPAVPAGYVEIQLNWNDETIRAWKNGDFYIFYASSPEGNEGWYRFDSIEGIYQRYDPSIDAAKSGMFANKGTIVLVAILAVVIVTLIIIVTMLALKLNDYKDGEVWEDDEDDEEEDEGARKEKAKKTWRALNFLTSDDFDDDDEDEDDEYDDMEDDEDEEEEFIPARPVRRPVQQPVRRTVQRPVQDGSRPEGQPVRRPVQRPVQGGNRPEGQPVRRPVQRPVQDGSRPEGQPVRRPVQRPVQGGSRPEGQPVRRPVQRPVQGGSRPDGEPVRRPVQKAPARKDMDFIDIDSI